MTLLLTLRSIHSLILRIHDSIPLLEADTSWNIETLEHQPFFPFRGPFLEFIVAFRRMGFVGVIVVVVFAVEYVARSPACGFCDSAIKKKLAGEVIVPMR